MMRPTAGAILPVCWLPLIHGAGPNHRGPESDARRLPCIRDTRVTVSAVLGQLAAGASVDEVFLY